MYLTGMADGNLYLQTGPGAAGKAAQTVLTVQN